MAKSLKHILAEFTESIDQTATPALGGATHDDNVKPLANAATRMAELAHKNAYMMHTAVALVLALFLGCVALVIYYRHTPNIAILVMGGNGLQLLLLVGWLRRLWMEKTTVETLLIAVEELPPNDAARLLTAFYFRAIRAK
jgi:hypothetical protein